MFPRLRVLLRGPASEAAPLPSADLSLHSQQVTGDTIPLYTYRSLPRSLLADVRDWDAVWFGSRSLPQSPLLGDMPQAR